MLNQINSIATHFVFVPGVLPTVTQAASVMPPAVTYIRIQYVWHFNVTLFYHWCPVMPKMQNPATLLHLHTYVWYMYVLLIYNLSVIVSTEVTIIVQKMQEISILNGCTGTCRVVLSNLASNPSPC